MLLHIQVHIHFIKYAGAKAVKHGVYIHSKNVGTHALQHTCTHAFKP